MSLRPRSVRMRLTLWYGGALAIALCLYAGVVYLVLWRMLSAELDRQLEQDIRIAERMLEEDKGILVWDDDDLPEEARAAQQIPAIEATDAAGKVLYRSPSFPPQPGPGDREFSRLAYIEDVPVSYVRATRPTGEMRRELLMLALVLGLGIPGAVLLAGGGGYALARRALAPVDRMAERARQINADRLSERLPVEYPHDELGRLATAFNEGFARLERSFEQLRRFTADASHELRTPLTAIRSVGEVGLRNHRDDGEYREIIGSMLEESDRLTRLVDSLLTLSRADGGQMPLRKEKIDAGALAIDVAQRLQALAEEKSQTLNLETQPGITVAADNLILRQALGNLIDNAIKYSAAGTAIDVRARREGDHAIIEVADAGPGIAPEHRERIFDRFYRVDAARSREMGGTGLGLAIARWCVQAHDGKIELDSVRGKGSTFRIVLPAVQVKGEAQGRASPT